MGLRMSKVWTVLSEESIAVLPAQLGVYQVRDADGTIIKIGYAGGNEPFGMRSALSTELGTAATHFRHEFTHGYMTRWQELLMIHTADHGSVPQANSEASGRIGRLSIDPPEST